MMREAFWGALAAAALSSACGPGLGGPAAAAAKPASLNIPPAVPPRPKLTPEEAALIYPDMTADDRDPFMTEFEQHPPPEAPVVVAKPAARKARPAGPRPLVLKQLHESVSGIITGPRNTFFFQGKLFEEGDTLPDSDWVVISIKPSGIRLRSKDNATDFLPFVTDDSGSGSPLIIKKAP